MTMFTIEELVSSAFSGGSLDLEAAELAEMTNVVSAQVESLLLQYVAGPDNVRLLPNRPAEMLSRCIGDLGINQREIQERSYNVFHQLFFGDKLSNYTRSILELSQTATDMRSISKLTILPKMSIMMGSIEAVRQPIVYLMSIGFSEPIADQLYNGHQQCKDIFCCMLLVTLYGFFMKLPSETGSQSLRGVRPASPSYDGEPMDPQAEVNQPPTANAGPQAQALQDGGLDATVRALVGLVTNLVSQVGDLRQELATVARAQQGAPTIPQVVNTRRVSFAPVRSFASLTAENEVQTTANQARQAAIDDDLLFEETLRAMDSGMNGNNNATRLNPGNPAPEGEGIVDARMEMKLDYGQGREDLTLSDFICALTSSTGVLLCGVSQRIHFIQREHSKHANRAHKRILTAPINPDKLSAISHLGLKDKIRNMYPVTVDHLLQFILQEWVLSQEIEDTGYRSLPGLTVAKTNSKYLAQYRTLMEKLISNVLHGKTNDSIQSNAHHITIFSLIFRFHLNRYNRACIHKDLSILVQDFHSHWMLEYATQLGNGTDGLTLVPLSDAMELLSYVCERCGRFAVARQFCPTPECQSRTKPAAVPKSSNPGFFQALKKYRALEGNAAKTEADFCKTAEFKALGPAVKVVPEVKGTASHSSDTCSSFSHRQNEIPLPAPLDLSN